MNSVDWHRKQFMHMIDLFRRRNDGETVCERRARREQADCAICAIRRARRNHFIQTEEKQIPDDKEINIDRMLMRVGRYRGRY